MSEAANSFIYEVLGLLWIHGVRKQVIFCTGSWIIWRVYFMWGEETW